jgi:hypothetical protein
MYHLNALNLSPLREYTTPDRNSRRGSSSHALVGERPPDGGTLGVAAQLNLKAKLKAVYHILISS